ncbi:preprotein translocase subunit SecE [Candidatus Gracilibacteria bacterium CG17_big_fil_post_rev_8_21_14_2_50_48_13]|nr:MAG: preprotein translocase subunit SecE [Candidatus Gracilibacteria bacterium CG17_big_fil_post_rev_8_21_14_2_50_48_13]
MRKDVFYLRILFAVKMLFKYIRDAVKELGFVTWPKNDVLIRHSFIVLAVTLLFAAAFWLVDGGMRYLVAQYIEATAPFHGTGTTLPETASGVNLGDIQVSGAGTDGIQIENLPVTPAGN